MKFFFMTFEWKRAFLEHWESFAKLFRFHPLLTQLIYFRLITPKKPISKHCYIFSTTAPINELLILFTSLTQSHHFRTIGEDW